MRIKRHAIKILCTIVLWATVCGFTVLPRTDYTLTVYAGDKLYIISYPEVDISRGALYIKDVDAVIDRIYSDTAILPTDATVCFHPGKEQKFTFTKERQGKHLIKSHLKAQISDALKEGKAMVYAKFQTAKPSVTEEDLIRQTALRAEFSTDYSSSSDARKNNISLACCAINGTFLKNGGKLSFNAYVGERNRERGYQEAKIILNGKFESGVGGGVCQVSTTLYTCALLAGMDVTERHQHTLLVSYIEPSFDAMVSSASDLCFTNNSGAGIFIEALADGNRLLFRFYGLEMDFSVERHYELVSVEDSGYDEILDQTGELCEGEEQKIITPSISTVKSKGFITVKKNGVKITTLLSQDVYLGRRGVIAKKGHAIGYSRNSMPIT